MNKYQQVNTWVQHSCQIIKPARDDSFSFDTSVFTCHFDVPFIISLISNCVSCGSSSALNGCSATLFECLKTKSK